MIDLDALEQAALLATPESVSLPWYRTELMDGGIFPDAIAADHIANCDPQTVIALVTAVRTSWKLADVRSGDFTDDELFDAYVAWDAAMKAIYGDDE